MLETPQMERSNGRWSGRELPGVRSSSLRYEDPDSPAPGRPSRSSRRMLGVSRSAGSGRGRDDAARIRGARVGATVVGPRRVELNRRLGHQPGRGRPASHRPRSSFHGPPAKEPGSNRCLLFLRSDDNGGRIPGQHRARLGRLPGGLHQPPSLELFGRPRRVDDTPVRHRRARSVGLPSGGRNDLLNGRHTGGESRRNEAAATKEPRPRRNAAP